MVHLNGQDIQADGETKMPGPLKNRMKLVALIALSMVFLLQTAIAGNKLILVKRGDAAPSLEVTTQRDVSSVARVFENDLYKICDDVSPALAAADTTLVVRQGKSDSTSQEALVPHSPASHNWLLVIGIDKYLQWRPLRNSVHDSKAVRDILIEHYMFDRDYVMELYDEQATRENIIKRFEELAEKVEANDNVLIYYAGHGEHNQTFQQGYWIPVDADKQSTAQYLPNTDLQTFLGAIKSRSILVISDACFSGTLFPGGAKSLSFETTHRFSQEVAKLKARQALISGGNGPVMDGGVFLDQHSIFAHYLIDRLTKNTDKYLTASTLYERLKDRVSNKSFQTPECNAIQNTGDEGGEYLFVRE